MKRALAFLSLASLWLLSADAQTPSAQPNRHGQVAVGAIAKSGHPVGKVSFSQCDINQQGTTNIADAQAIINQALGKAPPVNDLNADGVVNVVDVEILIDAALGLGCSATSPSNTGNEADSVLISVLNTADPISQSADPTNLSDSANSLVVSVLNTVDPVSQAADATNISDGADSQVVSVLNMTDPISQAADPTNVSESADSQVVSVLNMIDPIGQSADPTNISNEADTALVSLSNGPNNPASPAPAVSARTKVREFTAGFADDGSVQVAQSGSATGLVAGQTLAIGVRAPRGTQEVELFVNGASLAKLRQGPWVFTFNVPVGLPTLAFSVAARDDGGSQLASFVWQQPILPDAGTVLSGRVVDAGGNPVSGAHVTVEAAGWYGEFFELGSTPTQMPDLPPSARTRAGLVAGLDWLNPQGAFGDNPMGVTTTTSWAARLSGRFDTPESGTYKFAVRAQAAAAIKIDGNAVSGSVDLATGTHAIAVSYYKASEPASLELLWAEPSGAGTVLPLDGVSASDPALAVITGEDGVFSIAGGPAKVDGVRIVVRLADGRTGASEWQSPANGSATVLGDVVVTQLQH